MVDRRPDVFGHLKRIAAEGHRAPECVPDLLVATLPLVVVVGPVAVHDDAGAFGHPFRQRIEAEPLDQALGGEMTRPGEHLPGVAEVELDRLDLS